MILKDKSNPITEQAEVILNHRYYLKDKQGDVIEDSFQLFQRVADAISKVDVDYGKLPVDAELTSKEFYTIMSNLEFIPNSPTLMNAGTEQGTLSACFVLPLEDSME